MNTKIFFSSVLVFSSLIAAQASAQVRSGGTQQIVMASYRPKTAGLLAGFSSLSRSGGTTSGSTTAFYLDTYFGWNHVQYEFGPKLYFSNSSGGGNASISVFGLGAYGDYNFVPNRVGEKFVYGLTGDFMVGSASSGGTSGSSMGFSFGGVGKWYFASSSTSAVRMELVYDYDKSGSVTTNGIVARAGFQTYF